ncbi:MmgE/PrpD family protein [Mycolicibacterium goodii]|uniref:MmgE/PrpD family protein n=1 Tax=Mycolicibacterium goodii TaxID=134601 RepID=UPI000AC02D24
MTHRDLVLDVAQFASTTELASLDHDVVAAIKTNILDTLACALAGSSAEAIADVSALVREWAGTPQADMWVFGGKYPAHHAAWVNAAMAHARDYDDTHDAAILHAGVSTVPAAIAAGQLAEKCTGADLIAAVAAGLEITCRLGVAVQVDIVESGFIYSSLLGYFGATAAAGRAIGLTPDEMVNAFGIVYSSVAGNHQVTRDASLMKRLQPALAAQAAVVAVQLAKRGIRGAQEVFEGADGFFRVYLQNRVDAAAVRKGLGTQFELLNLSYKPYPCCRDTHAAIDAALLARAGTGRPAEDIEAIEVGVTGPGYQMVCVPEHVRMAPRTVVEAQFSIPYTVAAAWIDGPPSIGHFTSKNLQRPDVLELAARVKPYVDGEIDREWSRFVTPAKVTVRFRDGESLQNRVDYPKGHPKNMMTQQEFATKASDCATYAAAASPADIAGRLSAAISDLESLPDVEELVHILT